MKTKTYIKIYQIITILFSPLILIIFIIYHFLRICLDFQEILESGKQMSYAWKRITRFIFNQKIIK